IRVHEAIRIDVVREEPAAHKRAAGEIAERLIGDDCPEAVWVVDLCVVVPQSELNKPTGPRRGHDFSIAAVASGGAAGPEGAVGVLAVVAAEVRCPDADAAAESGFIREETEQHSRPVVGPAERLDVRTAAVAGAGNDVVLAVAVDVADGDVHAAA